MMYYGYTYLCVSSDKGYYRFGSDMCLECPEGSCTRAAVFGYVLLTFVTFFFVLYAMYNFAEKRAGGSTVAMGFTHAIISAVYFKMDVQWPVQCSHTIHTHTHTCTHKDTTPSIATGPGHEPHLISRMFLPGLQKSKPHFVDYLPFLI